MIKKNTTAYLLLAVFMLGTIAGLLMMQGNTQQVDAASGKYQVVDVNTDSSNFVVLNTETGTMNYWTTSSFSAREPFSVGKFVSE